MNENTGGPAFPTHENWRLHSGMTLRDYFAAHAPAVPDWFKHEPTSPRPHVIAGNNLMPEHVISKMAYDAWVDEQKAAKFFAWRGFYANCMIAERME